MAGLNLNGRRQREPESSSALDITNVVAAFSEEQVGRITNLTKGRLRYWAKTGFFRPSFIEDNPRLPYSRFYSFRDIVALRTLGMLRVQNNVPLQHLRKVAEKLSHLNDDLWTKTTLFVHNRKVVLVNPETGRAEEIVSGQYLLEIPLKQVIDDTNRDIVEMRQRREDTVGKVTRHRSIARNAWVVSGTRIPVKAIRRLHEDGYSYAQIIEEYPDITEEDIRAALHNTDDKAA